MNLALPTIFAFLALAIYPGIRGKGMDLEQWSVGGRGFRTLFVFLPLAGEIYTTFAFLGGSGWAYGQGRPAFYILSYGALAYAMGLWLLPAIWRCAREKRALLVNLVVFVAVSPATRGATVQSRKQSA